MAAAAAPMTIHDTVMRIMNDVDLSFDDKVMHITRVCDGEEELSLSTKNNHRLNGPDQAKILGEMLSRNTSILTLTVMVTDIEDKGSEHLAHGIKVTPH